MNPCKHNLLARCILSSSSGLVRTVARRTVTVAALIVFLTCLLAFVQFAARLRTNRLLSEAVLACNANVIQDEVMAGGYSDAPLSNAHVLSMSAYIKGLFSRNVTKHREITVLEECAIKCGPNSLSHLITSRRRPAGDALSAALIAALYDGRSANAEMLIKYGADANAKGPDSGATALMLAARQGDSCARAATALVEHGANLNATDSFGRTALMYAASCDGSLIIERLLPSNPDVDMVDSAGRSALMYAAELGYAPRAVLLVSGGADPTIRCRTGLTAEQMALKNGHEFCARSIRLASPKASRMARRPRAKAETPAR